MRNYINWFDALFLKGSINFQLFNISSSLIALIGSYLLLALIYTLDTFFSFGLIVEEDNSGRVIGLIDLFGYILIAPIIETFILGLLIKLFLRSKQEHLTICIVSSIFFGGLHSFVNPVYFFGTIWSFFIFSHCYLTWLNRSIKKAYVAALIPHVFINSISALTLYIWD